MELQKHQQEMYEEHQPKIAKFYNIEMIYGFFVLICLIVISVLPLFTYNIPLIKDNLWTCGFKSENILLTIIKWVLRLSIPILGIALIFFLIRLNTLKTLCIKGYMAHIYNGGRNEDGELGVFKIVKKISSVFLIVYSFLALFYKAPNAQFEFSQSSELLTAIIVPIAICAVLDILGDILDGKFKKYCENIKKECTQKYGALYRDLPSAEMLSDTEKYTVKIISVPKEMEVYVDYALSALWGIEFDELLNVKDLTKLIKTNLSLYEATRAVQELQFLGAQAEIEKTNKSPF